MKGNYQAVVLDGGVVERTSLNRDGDWCVVGWVTSGGYGHYVKASLAQG